MRHQVTLGLWFPFTAMVLALAPSCFGKQSSPLPADVVMMIVEQEIEQLRMLNKAPICLTVDRRNPSRATFERLRKRYPEIERSGVCFKKRAGINVYVGTTNSSTNEIEVVAMVVDPYIPEGAHVALLLWEHKYRFERDSDGIWTLVSKTKTCCDIE